MELTLPSLQWNTATLPLNPARLVLGLGSLTEAAPRKEAFVFLFDMWHLVCITVALLGSVSLAGVPQAKINVLSFPLMRCVGLNEQWAVLVGTLPDEWGMHGLAAGTGHLECLLCSWEQVPAGP